MNITIDEGFRAICPPLTAEEYALLEASLIETGRTRDALIVWCKGDDAILLDGHNRYEICEKHNLPYTTRGMFFDTREEAELWIIENQLGRRNLADIDRVRMVRSREPMIAAQARRRMEESRLIIDRESDAVESFPQHEKDFYKTRDVMGTAAKVSGKTYSALAEVLDHGTHELQEMVRNKGLGASTAAKVAALPAEEQKALVQEGKKAILSAVNAAKAVQTVEPEEETKIYHPGDEADVYEVEADEWEDVEEGQEEDITRTNGKEQPELLPPADRLPWVRHVWWTGEGEPSAPAPKSGRALVNNGHDILHPDMGDDAIERILGTIDKHPEWTFIIETKSYKRASRIEWPANVWLGMKVSMQEEVDDAVTCAMGIVESEPQVIYLSCEEDPVSDIGDITGARDAGIEWIIIDDTERWMATRLITQAWEQGMKAYWRESLLKPEWPE